MNFSQRYGYKKEKVLQIESMDDDLRNSLWNIFYDNFCGKYLDQRRGVYVALLMRNLWINFFKQPIDEMPDFTGDTKEYLKNRHKTANWDDIYDFHEFVANHYPSSEELSRYITGVNKVLQREVAGYRFIEKLITPIIDNSEMVSISDALETPIVAVKTHIHRALELYSDRKNPDYRNSIKESISAVEAVCCLIANKPGADLHEAISKLKEKVPIHGALEAGFQKIYAYTSDEKGVRHKLMDEPTVDATDSLFMLCACSSFVNYLIAKAAKVGIKLH
ncbi:AbiJ-NTD4 domain-containing protein [Anaeroselena agilis]|uniref:HEPN AbiJ-N-terminal domain-containing protein n=1 Tax=Anaeroselena agilis TaxID=3063788 RepID=A0ABU3NXK0_9FIRM|nr:hypothetical protein [Selenomonadales bacterium 4137-cl]